MRVYDVGEESGYNFLVMEFVEGTDALELIKKYGPQKANVVADIGAGCARALAHAHESDVVHRDIKPANLMLPETGGVKVADFGLARALASDSGLTMTGSIMGTPDYMAPEQAQGEFAGAPADIYALGATMYHLFVGRPPFRGENPVAVELQHVTGRIVVPEDLAKTNIDNALVRLIHECTQKEMAQRPDNLRALERQLMKIARATQSAQKLMSEGATLFSTTGYKIDVDAIARQKEIEATAAITDLGSVQSPHLDNLRKAAEKARGSVGSDIQPPKPSPPASNVSQDLAELTGDMVREAKGRSRRSSGQIRALPADGKPDTRRVSSNAALSPHREEGSASSSRRSQIVSDTEDDVAWESYAAKSFPTFEKAAVDPGGGSDVTSGSDVGSNSSWDGGQTGSSSVNPTSMGYQSAAPLVVTPHYTPRAKKKFPVGVIVTIAVLAGLAGAIAYFGGFLDSNTANNQAYQPIPIIVGNNAEFESDMLDKHPGGASVSAIEHSWKKEVFYAADNAGNILQWELGNKPITSTQISGEVLCLHESEGRTLAVGTKSGQLYVLSLTAMQDQKPELLLSLKDVAVTTITSSTGQLVIGDSNGYVRLADGSKEIEINSGNPVTGLIWHNKMIWAVAGARLAVMKIENEALVFVSEVNLSGKPSTLIVAGNLVFTIINNEIVELASSGGIPTGVKVTSIYIGTNKSRDWVIGIDKGQVIAINPKSGQVVGKFALPAGFKVQSIGAGRIGKEIILGGAKGEVLALTAK
ncbi:MAG: serine/threonine protein kinase [Planctomycetes bacterium]|nr:serine/threonine protein kinase [Planctomycetota bacterium]